MPLNAGELTARIELGRDVVSRVNGAEKKTPETYATVWAKPEALSGRELWQAQQASSTVTWRFTVRYRADVRPQDYAIVAGRRLEIRSVIPDALRSSLALLCEAKDG